MVALLNDYYRIDGRIAEKDVTLFSLTLLPDYHAYAGHFPGNPVSPGVCNIQLIKECAEQLVSKRLFLAFIAKCRFSAVLTPQSTPRLQLRMRIANCESDEFTIHATLFNDAITYIEFKGYFTAIR